MKNSRLIIGIATAMIVIGLLTVAIINFVRRADTQTATLIADDVKKVSAILDRINKKCVILGFDEQQNVINFLTVEKFVGSEVGSMNLAYPDKWEGPYMAHNPMLQGKEYMIVQTTNGSFITPGHGVKLPNGSVIGKDLILDENADIFHMISSGQLSFRGIALATKLEIENLNLVAEVAELEE